MPTTPGGFPYPAGSDVPDVPYWNQQLAEAVDDAAGDMGWETVDPDALTGNIWVRRIGLWVQVLYDLSGTNSTDRVVATLPGYAAAPTLMIMPGTEFQNGPTAAVMPGYVTGASLRISAQSGVTRRRGWVHYPAAS